MKAVKIAQNKCTECFDGDELKNDFENVTNCYEKCDYETRVSRPVFSAIALPIS